MSKDFRTMNMHLAIFIWILKVTITVLLAVSKGTAGDIGITFSAEADLSIGYGTAGTTDMTKIETPSETVTSYGSEASHETDEIQVSGATEVPHKSGGGAILETQIALGSIASRETNIHLIDASLVIGVRYGTETPDVTDTSFGSEVPQVTDTSFGSEVPQVTDTSFGSEVPHVTDTSRDSDTPYTPDGTF